MDSVSMFFPKGKLSGQKSVKPDAYLPPQQRLDAARVTRLPAYGMEADGAHLSGLGEIVYDPESGMLYDTELGTSTPAVAPDGSVSAGATASIPGGDAIFNGQSLSQWAQTIANLYLTGKTVEAQGKIIDLNMARAQAGMAPLPASMFQPTVGMNFGLTPAGQQQLLMVAGIGAVALLLLGRKRK